MDITDIATVHHIKKNHNHTVITKSHKFKDQPLKRHPTMERHLYLVQRFKENTFIKPEDVTRHTMGIYDRHDENYIQRAGRAWEKPKKRKIVSRL